MLNTGGFAGCRHDRHRPFCVHSSSRLDNSGMKYGPLWLDVPPTPAFVQTTAGSMSRSSLWQKTLLDVPSRPSQYVWACQVSFPTIRTNSPPGSSQRTPLPLSCTECPKHPATDQINRQVSQSVNCDLRCPSDRIP